MRLILLLIVLLIVGWLTVNSLKSQTNAVGAAASQAGIAVPQNATPHEQIEAIGKAVEKMQADQAERQRKQLDELEKGQ
jgi:lipopolysaccharide export system protein LptC